MLSRIPDQILDDVLSRVDIVELIGGYLPLKKAGRNFKTTCPFHHEKTPSFMVSADKQIYHCFGCGESGNAFKFLMKYERLDFPEAVKMLATKAGVVLPESPKHDSAKTNLAAELFKVNELAAQYFTATLFSQAGVRAVEYCKKRGISKETAQAFHLGFAADAWDGLLNYLRHKGVALSLMEKAGLVLPKDNGGFYDRFRNRLIFPIFDVKERILGFGGRVLDASLPKYMNSPETPVYTKGKNLFGLQASKDAIRDLDRCVIVEGYLDAVLPYQHGVRNIVASLGTALTPDQVRLIKRYTHNVVMVYDPDNAGQMATLRSLDIFIEEEMDVHVAALPAGQDPDLFVRNHGMEGFTRIIAEAQSFFEFELALFMRKYNTRTIEGKAKVATEVLQTVRKCRNAVLQSEYVKRLAEALSLDESAVQRELAETKPSAGRPAAPTALTAPRQQPAVTSHPTEKLLVRLMLEEAGLIERIRSALTPGDFQDEKVSRIVATMFDLMDQGKHIDSRSLLNYFEDDQALQLICETAFTGNEEETDREKIVDDCIRRMKHHRVRLQQQALHEKIKDAQKHGDEAALKMLMAEFQELLKQKH